MNPKFRTHEIDELIAAKSKKKLHPPNNSILFPKLTIAGGATTPTPAPKPEPKEIPVQEPKVESLFDLNDIVISSVDTTQAATQQQNQQLLQDLSISTGVGEMGAEKKLTKESILSLYNNSGQQQQQMQQQQNPFLQQQSQSQQSQNQNFFNF